MGYVPNQSTPTEQPQKKEPTPVVSDKVVLREKSNTQKFMESLGGELVNAGVDVLKDVVMPAIRRAIYDVIVNSASAIFGEGTRPTNTTPYHKMYRANNVASDETRPSKRYFSARYDFGEPEFSSRTDASDVLDNLYTILQDYGAVSVADYLQSAGIRNFDYTANDYGWVNLSGSRIVTTRGAWVIKLPPPIPLGR